MLPGRCAQAWRHQPAFRRPRHFHDETEINLVTRGSCLLGVGDRSVRLQAGQLVVLQPGQDHELLEASPDLGLFVFALRPELYARALDPHALAAVESAAVSPALPSLEAELGALSDVRDPACVNERVVTLFIRALEHAPRTHAINRRMLHALRSEHGISEHALAVRLGTSASGISRGFRRAVAVPLVEYRARLRLMRFIALVDRGTTLTRAALDADFGSYAQCHRVFQRALRCSPQEYFRGLREERDAETHSGAATSERNAPAASPAL